MTQETLKQANATKAYLITRGPSHLKIVKNALELADRDDAAWSGEMSFSEKQGASYLFFEATGSYYSEIRLIVVEPRVLDKKKHSQRNEAKKKSTSGKSRKNSPSAVSLLGRCGKDGGFA